MEREELAANLFRITQTESRLKRDKVDTEKKACDTHNKIGKIYKFKDSKNKKWKKIY